MRVHPLDRLIALALGRSPQLADGWGDLAWLHALGSARAAFRPGKLVDLRWSTPRRGALEITDGVADVDMPALPLPAGALPARVRRVRLAGAEPERAAVVLAASREEGFALRHRVWNPLAREGVELLFLENPLYGARRATGRRGAPVRTVSEQLAMNLASVAEACALASWLRPRRAAVAVAGYSMGGYMAAATAAACGEPVGCAVLAGGLSPAPVYTRALLSRSVDFAALAEHGDVQGARERLRDLFERSTVRELDPPLRPDAVVIVALRGDGFVPLAEAEALHTLWPGSELRVIDGGHATGVLLQAEALRSALRDALARALQR